MIDRLPLLLSCLLFTTAANGATPLPKNSLLYLPILKNEQVKLWPTLSMPSFLAGQVEQETCISLTAPHCWSPKAELKVSDGAGGLREWGVGLGQVTKTKQFDNMAVWRGLDSTMKGWTVDKLYDPTYQLHGLVAYDKLMYNSFKSVPDEYSRIAFTLAAYNGGLGGVIQDRRVCSRTPDCDINVWFGNVENTSLKTKVAVKGYGQSFFQINRGYVHNVLLVRRQKYIPIMEPK